MVLRNCKTCFSKPHTSSKSCERRRIGGKVDAGRCFDPEGTGKGFYHAELHLAALFVCVWNLREN